MEEVSPFETLDSTHELRTRCDKAQNCVFKLLFS